MKRMHIFLHSWNNSKVFCGNRGENLGVRIDNLWAVKESALCKKCLKTKSKAEKD